MLIFSSQKSANTPQQIWKPVNVRLLGMLALVMPIIGALFSHVESVSHIGPEGNFISIRGLLIVGSLALMLFMPKTFLRILDRKGEADEHDLYQRARVFHTSYKLILLITLVLIIIAAICANNGFTGKDMRHLLATIGMMIMVYAMIIPFNILAWSLSPPDEN